MKKNIYEILVKLTPDPEFVSDAPKFLVEPSDVSGELGQNAVLTCKVDGNPAPTYTWFRNGDLQTVRLTVTFKVTF